MLDQHLIVTTFPQALPENIVRWKDYRITVLTESLFRLEKDTAKTYCDKATQVVWFRNMPQVVFQIEEWEEELHIITGASAFVVKDSIEESYVVLQGQKIPLNNEDNLLGTIRTLDCCNGELWIPYGADLSHGHFFQLEKGILSRRGVAILDDSASLLLGEDGTTQARDFEEKDLYIFAYGHDYRGAVKALFDICGKTPLIPRFALGNWWSRYHAYTEKEYLHTMDSLAERDVPFTVATVDMDWHWSVTLDEVKQITRQGKNDAKHGGNNGWTGYSWNTDLFPDYHRFLNLLHERNLKVTLNLHPAEGIRYFEDMYEEMAHEMGVDPSSEERIPFDIADPKFVNAYFKVLHKPYEHDGVDFWWIDWQQGEESSLKGLDPLWALNHYHYQDSGLEHMPLILSRYCGVGSHRYPLGFSGDTHVTWQTLDFLPYFTATASNIGYTWWSHDIGGHMYGEKDDELYVRFLQFGVFSPINRLHSSNLPAFTKEPWAYGNGTGLIAEEFLRFRHRLIPYLYSASYETTENGRALVEPMYYEYPEMEEAYRYRNQYLFGGQLMVAPVTTKSVSDGMAQTEVWLPEGVWTDIFTGDEYQGGRELVMVRLLDSIPVLAKEGGILVLDDRKHTNDAGNPDKLEVRIYNGNGNYTLHEDVNGEKIETIFVTHAEENADGKRIQNLSICCKTPVKTPGRQYRIKFPNIVTGEVYVSVDGKEYPACVDDNGCVSVVITGVTSDMCVKIIVQYQECEDKKRKNRILDNLTRLQMDNVRKDLFVSKLLGATQTEYGKIVDYLPVSKTAKLRMMEIF